MTEREVRPAMPLSRTTHEELLNIYQNHQLANTFIRSYDNTTLLCGPSYIPVPAEPPDHVNYDHQEFVFGREYENGRLETTYYLSTILATPSHVVFSSLLYYLAVRDPRRKLHAMTLSSSRPGLYIPSITIRPNWDDPEVDANNFEKRLTGEMVQSLRPGFIRADYRSNLRRDFAAMNAVVNNSARNLVILRDGQYGVSEAAGQDLLTRLRDHIGEVK